MTVTDQIKTRSRKVAEVRAAIMMATRRVVRATYATGPLYAELVLAVGAGEKAGLSRGLIAKTIRNELEAEKRRRLVKHTNGRIEETIKVHKGTAARYVMCWRWHSGRFLKHEKRVESVEIEGHTYKSPIGALQSGAHSFTRVFRAWRDAVQPAVTDLNDVPTSPQDSAERIVNRMTLPLLVKDDAGKEVIRRVKVLESVEGLAALLTIIHASPLHEQAEKLRQLEARTGARRPLSEVRRRAVRRAS